MVAGIIPAIPFVGGRRSHDLKFGVIRCTARDHHLSGGDRLRPTGREDFDIAQTSGDLGFPALIDSYPINTLFRWSYRNIWSIHFNIGVGRTEYAKSDGATREFHLKAACFELGQP